MNFRKIFRYQVADMLINLKINILELRKLQHDLERLLIMEQNMKDDKSVESIINTIRDSFGVALWIKDINHRFIFANKICCETILKCREDEVSQLTLADFAHDALAMECIKSDKIVMESLEMKRFIEYAVCENGRSVFMDVIKSPRIEDGELLGTIGSGVIITESIPKEIRNRHQDANSIEVSIDTAMGTRELFELLDRRKDETRSINDNEKFQKFRKGNGLDG